MKVARLRLRWVIKRKALPLGMIWCSGLSYVWSDGTVHDLSEEKAVEFMAIFRDECRRYAGFH